MTQLPENKRIDRRLHRIEHLLRQQGAVISCITSLLEILMANKEDAIAEVGKLRQAIVDDQASDQGVVDKLDAIIAQLQAGADTSDIIAAVQEAQAQIKTVSSPNNA